MRPNTVSYDSFAIQTYQIIHLELSRSILSDHGIPQPYPVELIMPSKIGTAFTNQRKRKHTSENSETIAQLEVS
jgi:hypothetical protein